MTDQPAPNRLIDETSPYLLQHAHNPVDWYPWGPEALERARAEDRPILLSVGYAACHWCHVMAHESFEDAETAAQMNEQFVCVKVDREERPDLDGIYMDAVQAMTGHGGWPMTVFLTPAGSPFYAGTYYPKVDRPGMPSFRRSWPRSPTPGTGAATTSAARATRSCRCWPPRRTPWAATATPSCRGHPAPGVRRPPRRFDPPGAASGRAPSSPADDAGVPAPLPPARLPAALDMVRLTLDRMAAGGIFDQVGGGFHRYSTDGRWLVPHFEKMLYDNAQLVRLYTHAWQLTGDDRYRRTATRTADYLLRELRHPDGGFFSSQDADSEGVEGRFFVWSLDELAASPASPWPATWAPPPKATGKAPTSCGPPTPTTAMEPELAAALPRLFEAREARVHPATDDKVLAAWNGLAITALAEAARTFDEPRYLDAALSAASFVLDALADNGRLLRSWRDGRKGGPPTSTTTPAWPTPA
jgi:uncharacterized protein YyaL (SSP411 family)